MARAYSTFPFLGRPKIAFTSPTIRKLRAYPILASRIATAIPSKRIIINRKNHLRPKILKTLTKPLPQLGPTTELILPVPVPVPVPIPIQLLPENDTVVDSPNEIPGEILEEIDDSEEFRVSEIVAGEKRSTFGRISAKSVLKFCGWLVGVYLLQAILTVWVLGNNNNQERFDSLGGKSNNAFMNGNNVVAGFDESEMDERISVIRAMARKVREKEKVKRKEGNDEESEIEKEIGARLVKLEKRLNSKREKLLPDSFMNYLGFSDNNEEEGGGGDGDGQNGMEVNDIDMKSLMFKKKFKFKSPSMNSRSSPKGFSGLRDSGVSSTVNGSASNGKSGESDFGSTKLEKEKEDSQRDMGSGAVQKISEGSSSTEVTEASTSQDVEKLRSLTKGNRRTTKKFLGPGSSSVNDSREPGKRPVPNKVAGKQSAMQENFWWLNLPYVLVILMRRGSEVEGPGLYALRTLSQPDDHVDSYTVAFEDRGDANNFCHLLEFYFEGLGDFSADIVPLSVKELYEGVKSGSKKVIVVKKGQLKLYAGQPFGEVEMALFSLLE
ncbi:uncharacterized protein LOC8278727 [Ricinus communis]|uniref:uncharacterized protein LOC8278727 n=1 Tax=Ricinus communis TaxID=3988 RepID=UPI00201A2BD9|nr:uncharacterized protein LOC8278727 [Ricinus communis]